MKITQGFDRAISDYELDLDLNIFRIDLETLVFDEIKVMNEIMEKSNTNSQYGWIYIELDNKIHTIQIENSNPFHISSLAEYIAYNYDDYDYEIESIIKNSRWLIYIANKREYYGHLINK